MFLVVDFEKLVYVFDAQKWVRSLDFVFDSMVEVDYEGIERHVERFWVDKAIHFFLSLCEELSPLVHQTIDVGIQMIGRNILGVARLLIVIDQIVNLIGIPAKEKQANRNEIGDFHLN